jgi:MFS family permease
VRAFVLYHNFSANLALPLDKCPSQVAATMNATLYATFSIFGVLSGSLFNLLGTKILMSFGALTYAFYAISVYLWGQVDASYAPMAVAAAAILGIGAACLWGAQGTMTLSYALENQKGLFFGIFWLIFNMVSYLLTTCRFDSNYIYQVLHFGIFWLIFKGGVMGGFISMGINMSPDETRATSVTPETYFTFCGLMIAGSVFAFIFVLKPSRVVKADGTLVEFEQTDVAEGLGELKHVASLFGNKTMLLLTPLIIQVRCMLHLLLFSCSMLTETFTTCHSQIGFMHMSLEVSMDSFLTLPPVV